MLGYGLRLIASLLLAGRRSAMERRPDGTRSRSSRRVPRTMAALAWAFVSNSRTSAAVPVSSSAGYAVS